MAHNIYVPIAFDFRPLRASWGAVAAEITGWAPLKPPGTERCFLARVEECGTPYLLEVPWWGLPQDALRRLEKGKASELRDLRGYSAELLACSPATQKNGTEKGREADPWTMREEFLRLKRNTKALLAFLNKWGVWGTTQTSLPARPEVKTPLTTRSRLGLPPLDLDPERMPNIFASGLGRSAYMLPSDIWVFQQRCRKALTSPAPEWLTGTQKLLPLIPRRQYPHFVSTAGNCQEAIRTTITIDLMKRVKFRLCARPDCRSPFPVESQHRREYCRQYCAHIESVRRQRQAVKKETLHGKE